MVVLAVLLVGGGVLAVLLNSDEAKFARGVTKLEDARSLQVDFEISTDNSSEPMNIDGTVALNLNTNELAASIGLDVLVSELGLEALYAGDGVYVKVDGLAELEQLLLLSIGLSEAIPEGQADTPEAQAAAAQITALTDGISQAVSALDGQWIRIQDSLIAGAGLELDSVFDALGAERNTDTGALDLLSIEEIVGRSTVDGIEMVEANVNLGVEATENYLSDLLTGASIGGNTLGASEVEEALNDIFGSVEQESVMFKAWLDPTQDEIRQLQFEFSDVNEEGDDATVVLKLSDRDNVAAIETPADALEVSEVLASFGGLIESLGLNELLETNISL